MCRLAVLRGWGGPKAELTLSDEDRAALEGWLRRPSTSQAWALTCRITLACAEGASNAEHSWAMTRRLLRHRATPRPRAGDPGALPRLTSSPGKVPAAAAQTQADQDEVGDQNNHADDQQVEQALRHHTDDAEHDGHKDQQEEESH